MNKQRFFILEDEEYCDVLPCIRDRAFELNDIYGHYEYDDIIQICDFLNKQEDIIREFKEAIDDKISIAEEGYNKKYVEAKIKSSSEDLVNEVDLILDIVFYWKGYLKVLEELKELFLNE